MPDSRIYIYLLIMGAVTYLVRVLPLTLLRRRIRSRFLRSFLYYVPYVTLSVMTFPAIITVTRHPLAGALALAVGVIAAWFGAGLFNVSVLSCAVVFVAELIMLR